MQTCCRSHQWRRQPLTAIVSAVAQVVPSAAAALIVAAASIRLATGFRMIPVAIKWEEIGISMLVALVWRVEVIASAMASAAAVHRVTARDQAFP